MLPQQHKITSSEQFRHTIRKGKRAGGRTVLVYYHQPSISDIDDADTRATSLLSLACPVAGLIVSKAVGNAVTRHAVSRKLRHILRPIMPTLPRGSAVVIRALPASATADYHSLERDIIKALSKLGQIYPSTGAQLN
ncbi:ribonuclease P protein component [Corynebacterium sp. ES2794-CONJ1]|uniref:ribonuclease P protein component n=1 Tax=unclassified Corynebacterium TaxID=2624378 RepID=UPI0021673427|nr:MULTISPECIES: ribonuclease P protein component [unclassified Corynebacterium]MCS4490455.1 ribonuclease P protein component [Corynebacterium sp. ES2775-CONJ]MCU9519754.1 ribonuclease P protein component [Corynebacterium sp. ES2794-CONJ1]